MKWWRHSRRVHVGRGVRVGRRVRVDVERGACLELCDWVSLGDGCRLHVRAGTVIIGEGTELADGVVIVAHERVEIGRDCRIGDRAAFIDHDPDHADVEHPLRVQGINTAAIVVGERVTIGPGAVVGAGAHVPDNAILDAGSVLPRTHGT